MARLLTSTALRSIYQAQTDEVFILLLTIRASGLSEPIRVSSDARNTVSRDNLYLAFPFQIGLISEREDQVPEIALQIDNVDRSIIAALRGLNSPPTVTIEIVLASDLDTLQYNPLDLTMRSADYDSQTIQARLYPENIMNQAVPGRIFSPADFPGLF